MMVDDDKQKNEYKRLMIPFAEFETIESRNGEIATPLAAYVMKEVHLRAVVHVDTIHYLASFRERNILYWQIPYAQVVSNNAGMDQGQRIFGYMLGLMSGAMNCLADGFPVQPAVGIYQITVIDTSVNIFHEAQVIKKSETLTSGPQMDQPGSIPSAIAGEKSTGTPAGGSAEAPAPENKNIPTQLGPAAKVGEANGTDNSQNSGSQAK